MKITDEGDMKIIAPDKGKRLTDGERVFDVNEIVYISKNAFSNNWEELDDYKEVIFDASSDIQFNLHGVMPEVAKDREKVKLSFELSDYAYFGGILSENIPDNAKQLNIVYTSSLDHEMQVKFNTRVDGTVQFDEQFSQCDDWSVIAIPIEDIIDIKNVEFYIGTGEDLIKGEFSIKEVSISL